MSLSRSPSPHPGGGWSSPGLTPGSGTSSPRGYAPSSLGPGAISWAAAKAKSDEVRRYPSFSTRNSGFFSRQKHRLSTRLSSFRGNNPHGAYVDKDAHGPKNWHPGGSRRGGIIGILGRCLRRGRLRLLFILCMLIVGYLLLWSSEYYVDIETSRARH